MRGDSWRRETGCGDQVAELVEGSLRLVVAVIAMPSRACLGRAGKVSEESQNTGDSNIIGTPKSRCT